MADTIQPAGSLAKAIPFFRRPFTAAAVKFKVQVNPKDLDGGRFGQALCVCYIDARLVAERLNVVCPGAWSDEYSDPKPLGDNVAVTSRITVFEAARQDVGVESVSRIKRSGDMAIKGLYSDAFKRAGVKFGIGAFLYVVPQLYVDSTLLKMSLGAGDPKWFMTPKAETELRKRYQAWLDAPATQERFGAALDHGDVIDGQGDVETVAPVAEPEQAPASQPAVKPRPPTATDDEVRAIRRSANDKPVSPLGLVAIVADVSGIAPPTFAGHTAAEVWLRRVLPHLPSEHVAGVLNAIKNAEADV